MKERTSRPATAKSSGARARGSSSSARKSAGTSSGRNSGAASAAPLGRARPAGAAGGRAATGTASEQPAALGGAPRSIPAESQAAKEQAARDESGETRPGFTRRTVPAGGANYGGNFYSEGENREVPQGLSDHLDHVGINPDASTEANRDAKFSGGAEDDQDAQGEAVKSQRESSLSAHGKHRTGADFEPLPRGGEKSGGKSGSRKK